MPNYQHFCHQLIFDVFIIIHYPNHEIIFVKICEIVLIIITLKGNCFSQVLPAVAETEIKLNEPKKEQRKPLTNEEMWERKILRGDYLADVRNMSEYKTLYARSELI